MMVTPPVNCARTPQEHRARTRRWGHEEKRRDRWGRRRNRKALSARPERAAGIEVPTSSPVKKPRRLYRVESVGIIEDEVATTPKFAVGAEAPTPSPAPVAPGVNGNPSASSPVKKPRQLFRVQSVDIIEDEVVTPKFTVGVGVQVPTPSLTRVAPGVNGNPDDGVKVVLARLAASSPVQKPRQLFRVESVDIIEDDVATPKSAVGVEVPTPSPTRVAPGVNGNPDDGAVILAHEAPAPAAHGSTGAVAAVVMAPPSPTPTMPAAASTVSGLFLAPIVTPRCYCSSYSTSIIAPTVFI
jgi:hypothetical protein